MKKEKSLPQSASLTAPSSQGAKMEKTFIYAGFDKKKPPLSRRFLARLKEFESPTFRLGGGRSILLSYKRIYYRI